MRAEGLLVDNDAENRNLQLGSRNLEGVKLVPSRDINAYHLLGHKHGVPIRGGCDQAFGGAFEMKIQDVLRRPVVTEKGVAKKEAERTMCFEVAPDANKIQIRPPWSAFSR